MAQERLLQWLGLLLAVLLLMAAAFSLGVVVGRHGWLDWQPEARWGGVSPAPLRRTAEPRQGKVPAR